MTRAGETPCSSTAFTKSRSEMSRVAAAQHAGHLRGVAEAHGDDDQPELRPDDRHEQQGEDELWEGEDDVDGPHDEAVASGRAGTPPRCRRPHPTMTPITVAATAIDQQLPPAVEHPGQHVTPEGVAAQQELAFDGWAKGSVTKFVGEYGATKGPMTATSTTKVTTMSPTAPLGVRAARPRLRATDAAASVSERRLGESCDLAPAGRGLRPGADS